MRVRFLLVFIISLIVSSCTSPITTTGITEVEEISSTKVPIATDSAIYILTNTPTLRVTPTSLPTKTPTFTVTPSPTTLPTQTPVPTPIGGIQKIIFHWVEKEPPNQNLIYLANLDGSDAQQVFEAGTYLQGLSPDGKKVLVSKDSQLYTANPDGTDIQRIAGNFYKKHIFIDYIFSNLYRSAYWKKDGTVVYISLVNGKICISKVNQDGTNPTVIVGNDENISPLYVSPYEGDRVYWQNGYSSGGGIVTYPTLWEASLDGLEVRRYYRGDYGDYVFSSNNEYLIRRHWQGKEIQILRIGEENGVTKEVPFRGDFAGTGLKPWEQLANVTKERVDFAPIFLWSLDGDRVYYSLGSNHYIYSISTKDEILLPFISGIFDQPVWSPDQMQLFVGSYEPKSSSYKAYLIDLDTMVVSHVLDKFPQPSSGYVKRPLLLP